MEYEVARSKRKTFAIEIKADGRIVVRVPEGCSQKAIEAFVAKHLKWINRKLQEQERRSLQKLCILTAEEKQSAIRHAQIVFPERVKFYATLMQVDYGRITIREQKTRWGSCGAKGNLNFNWRLVLAPEPILDYVVVHELAHRKHMDHSKAFYDVVAEVMPDYRQRRKWLRENGWQIL